MLRMVQAICCGLLVVAAVPGAQVRVPRGTDRPKAGVTIALQSGAGGYQATGQGTCTYAKTASIYGVPSEQWSVQHSEDSRSLTLTFWKPTNGAEPMFTLSTSSGSSRQSVNTVKATGAPATEGSGTVSFAPADKGGTFTIAAKDAKGRAISGTIKCDSFTPAIAEGGD
jgi:hypothetical protein